MCRRLSATWRSEMHHMTEPISNELRELRKSIDSVEGGFSRLLSGTISVMLLLAVGMVLRVGPVMWLQNHEIERIYLPQLLGGLLLLVILLSCYVWQQRKHLKRIQDRLIRELVRCETAERLAIIDPLTDLYNRRYGMQAIAREIMRARRQKSSLGFLMVDVDNFKRANDLLGHLTGDRILRDVALLLQRTLRSSDIISRYGGDEFLVILIDTDNERAVSIRARLQQEIDRWNEKKLVDGYQMALSCGTAIYKDGADPEQVLAAADKAMYADKLKDSGRSAFGRELWPFVPARQDDINLSDAIRDCEKSKSFAP